MEISCKSCQVIKLSLVTCINIILANRDECVDFLLTYMHTGSLNFRPLKSYWPFSVRPRSHGARPAQAGKNRSKKSAHWGSKHGTSFCSGLWFSPGWHNVFSGYRKTHFLPCEMFKWLFKYVIVILIYNKEIGPNCAAPQPSIKRFYTFYQKLSQKSALFFPQNRVALIPGWFLSASTKTSSRTSSNCSIPLKVVYWLQ